MSLAEEYANKQASVHSIKKSDIESVLDGHCLLDEINGVVLKDGSVYAVKHKWNLLTTEHDINYQHYTNYDEFKKIWAES